MEGQLIGRQQVWHDLGLKQLGEEAQDGQHREDMKSIADEAVLSLSFQWRITRHRIKTTWGNAHHLGTFRWQGLPPLLVLPQQGALLIRRGRKPPGI
jgi:hypothetical protein